MGHRKDIKLFMEIFGRYPKGEYDREIMQKIEAGECIGLNECEGNCSKCPTKKKKENYK